MYNPANVWNITLHDNNYYIVMAEFGVGGNFYGYLKTLKGKIVVDQRFLFPVGFDTDNCNSLKIQYE
jgi:hypothetical protein